MFVLMNCWCEQEYDGHVYVRCVAMHGANLDACWQSASVSIEETSGCKYDDRPHAPPWLATNCVHQNDYRR